MEDKIKKHVEQVKKVFETKPSHVLKAEEIADIIIQEYPIYLHSQIISAIKNRIILTHQKNIEEISKV